MGAVAWAVLTALVGYLINGWAASILWGWFLVPLGAVQIGVWHAAGLIALVTMVMPGGKTASEYLKESNEETWTDAVYAMVVAPAITLALGFVMKLFAGV